jgi:HPt (histidine-containing phosphotransfer) domain-containing protein
MMFDEKNGYKKQMEAHLIHEYNLSPEQAQMMVQIGCQDIKKNMDKIAALVINQENDTIDYDSLKKVSHSLKGVLLNFGMQAEAEIAQKLERATKTDFEPDAVEKLLTIAEDL